MTVRAVLLAHPSGHSASPAMHDAAFGALGIDARYEAWDVPPGELATVVPQLRSSSMLGANVSVPHKVAVMEHLDEVRDRARAIGAVNLVWNDGGRLVGDNADAAGFLRSLVEAGIEVKGRDVAMLGAGGAARAATWALLAEGVASVRIWNRTQATARTLAAGVQPYADGATVHVVEGIADLAGADLWVQTTTLGMEQGGRRPDTSPVPADAWSDLLQGASEAVAVDLVYRPRVTPFLRAARAAGAHTVDGSGMLLYQGAVAFEAWTGVPAPVETMRAALDAALKEAS